MKNKLQVAAVARPLAPAGAPPDAIDEARAPRTAAGLPATGAYLALHLGEVSYGNIGGVDRLERREDLNIKIGVVK